ncbi:MAG: endonuclease MutS2 [Clostridia bacterium]|nr:endonuclease MutS2 [Clostridia bacterium]
MNAKAYTTLEFNKIRSMLSEFAVIELARTRALKLEPSTDIREVNEMQEQTACAMNLMVKKGNPPIHCKADIRGAVKRADMGGVLTPADILDVGKVLKTSRSMKAYPDDVPCEAIEEYIEALFEDKKLESRIFDCIADEETVADTASAELASIRRKIRSTEGKIKEILHNIISKNSKYLQDAIITMRSDRYVVPVKAEHKGSIRGIVHDTSASGITLFIEPEAVVEAGNEIRMLKSKEADEIERILRELSGEIGGYSQLLEMTYNCIADLDLIFAKGKFALKHDAFRPVLNDDGYINLVKARHPLLDPKKVVPTNIYLGKDFDTLVITGPNTGGKTVVLKTLGIMTLMAQSGMHITANEGSVISVFDNVFADIGDEQSIEQSLSTFSSHMVNIVNILNEATYKSLCLFDELGAGTDPVEGAALAVSILENIRLRGAKSAATTHYSELKSYALSTDRVENASCEFDVETLAPTYKLLIGIPGKSNAFAISQKLGISEDIINDAKSRIAGDNIKFEDVITNLESARKDAERERDNALVYKQEIELLKDRIAHKNKSLENKTDKIIEAAHKEAQKIIEEARAESELALADIRAAMKKRDLKEANKAVEQVRQQVIGSSKKHKVTNTPKTQAGTAPKTVKLGQEVDIPHLNQRGTVVTLPDAKGSLMVNVGIMKMKVNISDLRTVAEKPVKNKSGGKADVGIKSMTVSPELDIRGEDVESATILVEKFIDDAILSSLHEIRIIHGKGTGVLRAGIHSFLKKHKSVKSFRLGGFGEGDAGVTIAELK